MKLLNDIIAIETAQPISEVIMSIDNFGNVSFILFVQKKTIESQYIRTIFHHIYHNRTYIYTVGMPRNNLRTYQIKHHLIKNQQYNVIEELKKHD